MAHSVVEWYDIKVLQEISSSWDGRPSPQ